MALARLVRSRPPDNRREIACSPRRSPYVDDPSRRRCRARRRNRLAVAVPARNGARGTAWRAYERFLRTAARSVTADNHSKVIPPGPPCAAAGLSACLPAYLQSSPLLPPSPHCDTVRGHLERLPGERRTRTSLPGIGRWSPLNAVRILPRRRMSCPLIPWTTSFYYSRLPCNADSCNMDSYNTTEKFIYLFVLK